MRRLLATCLALLLAVTPAWAAITQISGTGPSGTLAGINYTTALNNSQSITAAVGAGNLIVILVQSYDTSPTFSCSDAASNTYQKAPNGAFRANAATEIWYSLTTNNLSNGAAIQCSASVHTGGFTTEILGFSGAAASPYDVSPTGTSGSGTSATVGASPTLTCPGSGTGCEVCVSGVIWNSNGTITSDATWTAIGNNATVGSWANGFKIVNANTALSFTGSTTATAAFAGAMACFQAAASGGTSYGGLTTLGAGP